MFLYTPENIAHILLLTDDRLTLNNIKEPSQQDILSQNFSKLSGITFEGQRDPRALSKAIEELQNIALKDNQITLLSFQLLTSCQDVIKSIPISTEKLKRPDMFGLNAIKRHIVPNYNAFMGTSFKFSLYGDDITNKISYDQKALEQTVFENLLNKLTILRKEKPALFKGKTTENHFNLNFNTGLN